MPVPEVSHEQRRYAKVINFGLIYGMSAFGLAANLGIERSAATAYIERYFARYPGVKRYMDETRASALERGYVETLFGRRVHLPEIRKPGPRKSAAERQAINAPMQGTAADLVKLAMIAVQDALDREGKATRMIMQVHDELVFEVPAGELDWAREAVPRIMAGVATLAVPLVAEVGVGAELGRGALTADGVGRRGFAATARPSAAGAYLRAKHSFRFSARRGPMRGAPMRSRRPRERRHRPAAARGRERLGPLRRHRRARPGLVRRRGRPHRRLDRPERRRQDDAVQLPVAPVRVQRRPDRASRAARSSRRRRTASPRSASAARSRTWRCSGR